MQKKHIIMLILLFLSIISPYTVTPKAQSPNTILVPDDYPYLSWAVSNASVGDVILIDAGKYSGIEPYQIVIEKPLQIMGYNGTPEIHSLPNILNPINITIIEEEPPEPLSTQQYVAPTISISNIVFNITTPHAGIKYFMYLNGTGQNYILISNVSFLGNASVLPNLLYTMYIEKSPGVTISNVTDTMPGILKVLDCNLVEIKNVTRTATNETFIDNNMEVIVESFTSRVTRDQDALWIRSTPNIVLRDLRLEDIYLTHNLRGVGILLYLDTSHDYSVTMKNITIFNINGASNSGRYHGVLISIYNTVMNLDMNLDNMNFTQLNATDGQYLSALDISGSWPIKTDMTANLSNIGINGYYEVPIAISRVENVSVKDLHVNITPYSSNSFSYIGYSNNINLEEIGINNSTMSNRASNTIINNISMKNSTIELKDSHLKINFLKVENSVDVPFIDADNSTIEINKMLLTSKLWYNMTIGNDALNKSFELYLLSPNDLPMSPHRVFVISPLVKVDTTDMFNISFAVHYEQSLIDDLRILEDTLGIIKYNGTSWIEPKMLSYSVNLKSNIIEFTLENAGDPIIVLYSSPPVVGGILDKPAYGPNVMLYVTIIVAVFALATIYSKLK